eukprot:8578560-Ditylum_brightwellii.AAC.2
MHHHLSEGHPGNYSMATDKDITATVQYAVVGCGLLDYSFWQEPGGSHILCTGREIVMKLNG